MPHAKVKTLSLALISCMAICAVATHAKEAPPQGVGTQMQAAAEVFLDSLSPELREQASFEFDDKQRTDWHFIPKDRLGVSFGEMNLDQRRAARKLMRSVLSDKGYLKATTIMSLERVLRLMEADRENVSEIRNPENYWFAIYGDPAGEKPWGWRVEGHHLSLNFTSVDGVVAGTTPLFLGANPAEVRVGPRVGLRVLGDEEDQARALMATLDEAQRQQTIISSQAPGDVLTVPGEPIDIGAPKGLAASEMTEQQQIMLTDMVESLAHHLKASLAEAEVAKIESAGIEQLHFAWAGSLDPEQKHYFRLHGPTFVLEYDNAQGNHVHLVWHSSKNNFAAQVLHGHYQRHHAGAVPLEAKVEAQPAN